jgi:hypothetical protein
VDPTPERFRRLALSAPYRWRSLVLEGTWGPHVEPARLRVERPDLVVALPADADEHVVRLDVATGVCVRAREVGGPHDGAGHDLVVVQAGLRGADAP